MYELDEIIILINNLDLRDALRKFGPKYAIIVVDKQLQVLDVSRYKKMPKQSEINELMSNYRGCAYFYADPSMYETTEKLKTKIESCKDAFIETGERWTTNSKGEKVLHLNNQNK